MLAAFWLAGLARFLLAGVGRDGVTITLPATTPHPAGEHNLASFRHGPTLRVSSFDGIALGGPHHPSFLVDERGKPKQVEKWASAPRDARPWVEISWGGPRALERVVVHHAGAYEAEALTLAGYRLRCLGPSARQTQITGNDAPMAIHHLACPDAHGIRLEALGDGVVRLYEIEAWGR